MHHSMRVIATPFTLYFDLGILDICCDSWSLSSPRGGLIQDGEVAVRLDLSTYLLLCIRVVRGADQEPESSGRRHASARVSGTSSLWLHVERRGLRVAWGRSAPLRAPLPPLSAARGAHSPRRGARRARSLVRARARVVVLSGWASQTYKSFWCFATSWLVVPFTGGKVQYTPWGIVSALFWVPAGVAAVIAVEHSGLALSQVEGRRRTSFRVTPRCPHLHYPQHHTRHFPYLPPNTTARPHHHRRVLLRSPSRVLHSLSRRRPSGRR